MQENSRNIAQAASDTIVICENSRAAEIRGTVLRLAREEVCFEVYAASEMVLMSEVLTNLKILVRDQLMYSGRATVTSLTNAGPVFICNATLQDSWMEINLLNLAKQATELSGAFAYLIRSWQEVYKVLPEYKLIIADIQSFLFELRHWVEEAELGLKSGNGTPRAEERAAATELLKSVVPCLDHLFEKFEAAANEVSREALPIYCSYAKRQLHPLLLCAPFMHRIYRKPLGYAGDYEMVNMMLRDAHEGSSLFAKVLNRWFLGQVPAEAHRNRISLLARHLVQESVRAKAQNRPVRIYNLGCGPAKEVSDFMEQSELSNQAQFTLLDFNEETLACARSALDQARQKTNRSTRIQLVKKSVANVLKAGMRNIAPEYDLVYCAGLFDYLPDRSCRQLMETFYGMLNPGGLLLVTNVDRSNPIRNIMGYIFEWWLIERNAEQMRSLAPAGVPVEECKISSDFTGCNLFMEVRKPTT